MTEAEQRLLELLKQRSFKLAPPGQPFTTKSGAKSDYYIDGRTTSVSSEGAHLIGEVLYERTNDLGIGAIGGLQVGAVPLVTAAAIAYHRHGTPIEGFWVRDAVKDHGTKKRIEGALKPGTRVAIVDDVFTSGGSALEAAKAAQDFGCEVVLVLALVDRLRGARVRFEEAKIAPYQSVFTIEQFGIPVPGTASGAG